MSNQGGMQAKNSRMIWRYSFFNLVLLVMLGAWFLYQNQPVSLAEPQLAADDKLQCISYAPYYKKGLSPLVPGTHINQAQIDHDLQLLAQRFHCVRIYSVSQGLDYVPEAASRLGLKVLLGAWIGWVDADNDKELKLAIKLANQYPDTVKGLVVGNEVLLRGEQTEAAMSGYLERAQQATEVPVTYADVWEFWLKHKALEKSVDFVTLHLLPYWEDNPQSIDNGMRHANMVMDEMTRNFNKPLYIGETGWPSAGRQRQKSTPSLLNQARYIREFILLAHDKGWNYNLIEAFDQPWKRKLEGTVGGYWGFYTSDLQAKFNLNGPVAERHDGWQPFYYALLGAFAFTGFSLFKTERRPVALLGIAGLGALIGASGLLEINYLISACNTAEEWKALGGMLLAGGLALISLLILLLQNNISPQTQSTAKVILHLSLLALLLGTIVTGWLLMTDGRYRDYPLAIYALPALQLSIGMRLAGIDTRPTWRFYYLLNIIASGLALACIWQEPDNLHAWLWGGLVALLGIATWPQRDTEFNKKT